MNELHRMAEEARRQIAAGEVEEGGFDGQLHMQGTGTLDKETFIHLFSMLPADVRSYEVRPGVFEHIYTPSYGARDWVHTPPSSSLMTHSFSISIDDDNPIITRRMLHNQRKRQAQGERAHRRKLIARRQKRAAFRRKMRGLA